jgi:hypothetical protein
MLRFVVAGLIAAVAALAADASSSPASVTFHKDVLPILQKNCQSCHRPGQIAPMSFLTYENVRPWAKAMKAAVVTKKMPPWFADPQFGHFLNDRSLKQSEIDVISQWADGAKESDQRCAAAGHLANRWLADSAGLRREGPTYDVPAKGVMGGPTSSCPRLTKDT